MVIRGYARDWYIYSATLHSYKLNYEASQVEAEKDEARMDFQDQGRSWEIVQCGVLEGSKLPKMVNQCGSSAKERWEGEDVCRI